MPGMICYRLKREVGGKADPDFDDYVGETGLQSRGSVSFSDFEAKLYFRSSPPQVPSWGAFLAEGLQARIDWPQGRSTSALLIVRIKNRRRREYFGLPFGPAGRFFLRDDSYLRAYGLKAALNLIYPTGVATSGRQGLRTVDSKRRSATLMRSRSQATSVTTFDSFDIDQLRDLVHGVDGRPADAETWGYRVAGADALSVDREELGFSELGKLCRDIDDVAMRVDYKTQFGWLDYVRPVTDPDLITLLRQRAMELVRSDGGELELAPPEMVDWARVHRFQFPFDGGKNPVRHPDLRLADLRSVLRRVGKLELADYAGFHGRHVHVLDVDGQESFRWTLWKCLTGDFELDGHTYVIDEGDFFEVEKDYLARLDRWVDGLDILALALPDHVRGESEGDYNMRTAAATDCLLLDKRTVTRPGGTAVELCDLLTKERQFIHVKKNDGSSALSHLFSQAVVSATALQDDTDFRKSAAERVKELPGGADYDIFSGEWVTSSVEVALAVIDHRWAEGASKVLPFFSKI